MPLSDNGQGAFAYTGYRGKIGECPRAYAHTNCWFAASPIGRLVGGDTSCHINFPLEGQEVPQAHPEASRHHHLDLHRAGRRVHQDSEDMGGHVGLMQGDFIPAYIAIRTFGCKMVAHSGFTPSMSVAGL